MSVAAPLFEPGDYVRSAKLTDRTTYRVLGVETNKYYTHWWKKNGKRYRKKFEHKYFVYILEEIIRHHGKPRKTPKRIGRCGRPIKMSGGLIKCTPKPFPSWDYEDWKPEDVR